jgi:hypothetical protein
MHCCVATAILAVLIGAGPAPAQWQDATETDSTGKKIVMQRTPAKGALSKSGREVTSNLYLRCDNPYDNRVKYRGHDYWSAFVLFSEPVSSVEARTRYSFDGGETTASAGWQIIRCRCGCLPRNLVSLSTSTDVQSSSARSLRADWH